MPLTSAERADVCIVGGGFTGLWTALSIKRLAPEVDVVLIERQYCGAGASGRNGGWVNGWDDALPKLVSHFGRDAALSLLDACRRSLDDIRDTVRDGDIDCDLTFAGGLTVALSPAQVDGVLEAAYLARDLGRDDLFRVLDKDEAVALSGSPGAEAGGGDPARRQRPAGAAGPGSAPAGTVAAGVRVYEATPMVGLQRTLPAAVETPSGSVTADKVVLAAGVRLGLVAELRRTTFIIPTYVVATASSPDALDRLGWEHGRPFADGRTAVHYAQRTADDRLVFGRGGGRLGVRRPRHPGALRRCPGDRRDRRRHVRPATGGARPGGGVAWGGPMERTQHGIPWVGTLGKYRNVHYGMGYAGNGVTSSNLIGRTLASLSLGLADDYARSPLVSEPPSYLPPEPIRSVGARAVRSAIERCEEMEDQGRRPDPVSRALRRCLSISTPKGVTLWRRDEMD